jgi:hypothetical protein
MKEIPDEIANLLERVADLAPRSIIFSGRPRSRGTSGLGDKVTNLTG